jgi:O-antigen ligase
MIKDRPLLGVGFGNYQSYFDQYDRTLGLYGVARSVHNTPLLVAAETGLIGVMLLGMALILSIIKQSRARRVAQVLKDRERAEELIDYVSMIRISMLGFWFGSLFVVCLFQEMLWILIALSLVVERVASGMHQREQSGEVAAKQ